MDNEWRFVITRADNQTDKKRKKGNTLGITRDRLTNGALEQED